MRSRAEVKTPAVRNLASGEDLASAEIGASAGSSSLLYRGYIPGLDVLRGVAILMVVLYHGTEGRVPWQTATTWLRWPLFALAYGASGVELFFILSGFLITSILLDTAGRAGYYRKFYIRRALRILPAYLLMLLVLKVGHVVSWRFILAALLYIANMASLVGARTNEYAVMWSLAVEEQFYLLWPWIVRRFTLKALLRLIVGWIAFALLLRVCVHLLRPGADTLFKLWFNADWLLSGALVAVCLRLGLLRRDNIAMIIRTLTVAAAISLSAEVFFVLHSTSHPLWMMFLLAVLGYYPLVLAFLAMLLYVLQKNCGREAQPSPIGRILSFFGYISYGLYLIHQLIFTGFDHLVRGTWWFPSASRPAGLVANTAVCLAASTGIAYLSRRYFEELFLRRKDEVAGYRDPAVNEKPLGEST